MCIGICWNVQSCSLGGGQQDFSFVNVDPTSVAAEKFTDILLTTASKYISKRILFEESSHHPWLTSRARDAIAKKHNAENSDTYKQMCKECSNVLYEEFGFYIRRCKARLARLPRESRQYWRLLRELSSGVERKVAIPALEKPNGEWARSSVEKAVL